MAAGLVAAPAIGAETEEVEPALTLKELSNIRAGSPVLVVAGSDALLWKTVSSAAEVRALLTSRHVLVGVAQDVGLLDKDPS